MDKIAVISHPRTGTRRFATRLSEIFGKSGFRTIVPSNHVGVNAVPDTITPTRYIIHGHWHSLHLSSEGVLRELSDCQIVEIRRHHLHRWLSSVIAMYTQSAGRNEHRITIPADFSRVYLNEMKPSETNRRMVRHVTHVDFDSVFGDGASENNFNRNRRLVENYDEIHSYYMCLRG